MHAIQRGVRNAFRNVLRTGSVTIILGISLGLVLVMLAARSAVDRRISDVKSSIGNTVAVSPAGARGFLGGGEPLTQDQAASLAALPHVTSMLATIDAQIRPGDDTTLASAIEAGSLGGRTGRVFRSGGQNNTNAAFTPPIFAIGTNDAAYAGSLVGANVRVTNGTTIDAGFDTNTAMIGKNIAEKNSLQPDSAFTAYGTQITVSGIFDADNEFANNAIVFPLKTLQRLSDQANQLTSIVLNVDSVDVLSGVVNAAQTKLGDAADVTSSADSVKNAIQPLESIQTIATTSLLGALLAATIITLLTMVMIVRERRKEIAVLKAIGADDRTITVQFVSEAVMLSLVGSVFGIVIGYFLSNPILRALLTSSAGSSEHRGFAGGPGGGGIRIAVGGFRAAQGAIRDLQAVVDLHLVLYVLLAAVVVAVIGSALPAMLIAKVRPAEVLRNE